MTIHPDQRCTRMKNTFKMISLLLLPLVMQGCASVLTGDTQAVTVTVTCKGQNYPTYCVAKNSKGSWHFNTPQTRVVKRDSSPLKIICHSPSIGDYGVYQYPGLNPASLGNVLAGGLVGTAVDTSNNSVWIYPNNITLESQFCKMVM